MKHVEEMQFMSREAEDMIESIDHLLKIKRDRDRLRALTLVPVDKAAWLDLTEHDRHTINAHFTGGGNAFGSWSTFECKVSPGVQTMFVHLTE